MNLRPEKEPSAADLAKEQASLWPEIHRLVQWANRLLEQNHLSERIEEAWKSRG